MIAPHAASKQTSRLLQQEFGAGAAFRVSNTARVNKWEKLLRET